MWRARLVVVALAGVAALSGQAAWADDLTGSSRLLCSSVQATLCLVDGECAVDLPWNLNVPQFIEVDLDAKLLSTTPASGENRTTPIEFLTRRDGAIVFHGFEMGRAFSWVIEERTGKATVALAAEEIALTVFAACTPMPSKAAPARD